MASISSIKSTVDSNEYQREILEEHSIEDKIVEILDDLTSKSLKTRMNACQVIQRYFRDNYAAEFLTSRKLTILDTIVRCLKRYKSEELGQFAILISLICVTIGSETVGTFSEPLKHISTLLNDHTLRPSVRADCAKAISTCSFLVKDDNMILEAMDKLYNIFKASGLKGDGKVPNIDEPVASLHSACLSAWTLLLIALKDSPREQSAQIRDSRSKIIELLDSSHLELRQAAGETLAVICELAESLDEDFSAREYDKLCEKFEGLISDSQKSKGKRELKLQRASFREISNYFEDREAPCSVVKFGSESLTLDSWSKRCQYNAFCDILGPGINQHLKQNEILRDMFGLGEVVRQTIERRPKRSKEVSNTARMDRKFHPCCRFAN